jgi:hypothetical protein
MKLLISTNTVWKKIEKTVYPGKDDWKTGLVLYKNGILTPLDDLRMFGADGNKDGKWIAGSSDNVSDDIECWFKLAKID